MRVPRGLPNHSFITSITIIGFALRFIAAKIDPFLHPWDERFHALVARNLMHHPWVPMLRAYPVTANYDPFTWCCNHIWLHKQPLFMWQMALSMKIFGVSELAMRLPSVIMGTLLIVLLYRIVIIFTNNKSIALISAAILCFSNFHLQIISGIHGMDHNDVAHGFYVLASIWAYAEYTKQPKWYWIILIGVFSGAAILNKWLTGLLVYLGWGFNWLLSIRKRDNSKKEFLHLLISLLVCILVFAPWQIYISTTFPELAKYAYAFNRRHITEALEGHTGDIFFYLTYLKDLLGIYSYVLLPLGILVAYRNKSFNARLFRVFVIWFLFVFLFFSLIVKTKVDTYFFFVAPIAMTFIAIFINYLFTFLKNKIARSIVIAIILYWSINPLQIAAYLSPDNRERQDRIYNASVYRNIRQYMPPDIKVVMNMNSFEDIDVMFYNNNITAYAWTLSEEDFKELAAKKIPVAVFEPHGIYNLSDYVTNYPYIFIIRKQLKDF